MLRKKISINGAGEFSLRKRSWLGIISQAILLMCFWLLLSGRYDLLHILLGVISVSIVLGINARINRIQFFHGDIPEWERISLVRILQYIPWLFLQIVVASLQVAYMVLHPRMPIKPVLISFKVDLPNVGAQVILGNSITLTPGTVTIKIEGDKFLVHALMEESSAGLIDGSMPRMVARLFRKLVHKKIVSDIKIYDSIKSLPVTTQRDLV